MKNIKNMILVLLIYVGILSFVVFVYGCSSNNAQKPLNESNNTTKDSLIDLNDKIEEQLKKTDTTINKIENQIQEVKVLKKENQALKVELKSTKDSLVATRKLIKKRTLIQKVLGINKDTIGKEVSDTTN